MDEQYDERQVFAYRTQRRALGSPSWEPGARLLFHVERGERSPLSQLSWRTEDGAEAAISLQSRMDGFSGHYRDADGGLGELQGEVAGPHAFPAGTEGALTHRFRTEEGWGGGWHPQVELRLLIDDGGAPVERIAWRDQRGNSASISLRGGAPSGGTPEATELVTEISASDEHTSAGEVATNLLTEARTKWLSGTVPAVLRFSLAEPIPLFSYTLTSANDFPERDPLHWQLLGSEDGTVFEIVDERSGERFTERYEAREFTVQTSGTYRHLRLHITRTVGSTDVQLNRVQFFAGDGTSAVPDFIGYYQRWNEGPIGYRGTTVLAPARPATATADNALAEAADNTLAEAAEARRAAAYRMVPATPGQPLTSGQPLSPGLALAGRPLMRAVQRPLTPTTPATPNTPAQPTRPAHPLSAAVAGTAATAAKPFGVMREAVPADAATDTAPDATTLEQLVAELGQTSKSLESAARTMEKLAGWLANR